MLQLHIKMDISVVFGVMGDLCLTEDESNAFCTSPVPAGLLGRSHTVVFTKPADW